jgi:hypothetical protein
VSLTTFSQESGNGQGSPLAFSRRRLHRRQGQVQGGDGGDHQGRADPGGDRQVGRSFHSGSGPCGVSQGAGSVHHPGGCQNRSGHGVSRLTLSQKARMPFSYA